MTVRFQDHDAERIERGLALLNTVETIKKTGGAVEIAGVKIEPCDEYGRTARDLLSVQATVVSDVGLFQWPLERPHFATVTDVIDGDTIRCDIDLDLRFGANNYKVRLAGCNAWESATDAGKAARDNLKQRLPIGTEIVLTTIKDYKYGGEFIARIWMMDGTDLIAQLIEQQWLAPWNGRGPAPTPVWPRTVAA